jgi:hypothetical protein
MTSLISLVWAVVLLVMILFVIGIFITQVVTNFRKDLGEEQSSSVDIEDQNALVENFGSLQDTMYSLYKAVTGGDDWGYFAELLFNISPIMGVLFCLYVAFAVFAVLNVVTGVFVDNALKANSHDADMIIMEQTEARKKHIDEVKSIFKKADSDASGKLNLDEFKKHVGNPYVQAYFRQLDIDMEGSKGDSLFNLLDFDSNGFIDIEEFIFGCGHLKGYARSLDLARMGHGQRQVSKDLMNLAEEQRGHLTHFRQETAQTLATLSKKLDAKSPSLIDRKLDQKQLVDCPTGKNCGKPMPPGTSPGLPALVDGGASPTAASMNLPGSIYSPTDPAQHGSKSIGDHELV